MAGVVPDILVARVKEAQDSLNNAIQDLPQDVEVTMETTEVRRIDRPANKELVFVKMVRVL